jgi:RHS repeat-associated protein
MPARLLCKQFGMSLGLLGALGLGAHAAAAAATATLTVGGAEQQVSGGWAQGDITIAFNGFTETLHYAQFSTPASLASAMAGMFSRDYIGSGLCAHAVGAVVTFQLSGTATFGALQIGSPSSSFPLTSSGWAAQGSPSTADAGTITLTVDGITAATTQYGASATPVSVAAGLAAGVTAASPVTVTASYDGIALQSKQTGSASNYSYTLQTTSYDSADFSQPSFLNPPLTGSLTGGVNQNTTGAPVYSYSVSSYDGVGNLQGMNDSVMGTWTYQYDDLNRVMLAANPGAGNSVTNYCWSYDNFGNRTMQEGSNAAFAAGSGGASSCTPTGTAISTDWAQYDGSNHVTLSAQSPGGVDYDASGDTTNDGVNKYLYDADGHICAVSGAGGMTGYLYNAEGERVEKGSITSMSCDPTANGFRPESDYILGLGGEQLTQMTVNASGVMTWQHTNVYAAGALIATYDTAGLHFLLNDMLGTRRAQTDYAGVLEQTCSSLPFGDQLNCTQSVQNPNSLHFTGKERDAESGLDYFGARYYASNMGRFMSPDWSSGPAPIPYANIFDPQTLNLYTYAGNNPLSRFDPNGHNFFTDFAQGLADSTYRPFVQIAEHPIATAQGVGNAIEHPVVTGKAIGSAVAGTVVAAAHGNGRAIGQIVGTVGTAVAGGAALRGVGAAGEVGAEAGEFVGPTTSVTTSESVFYHYGFAADESNFANGLLPGSYATTTGDLTGSGAKSSLSLPHANAPDSVYQVTPGVGTPINGPDTVAPQFGQPGGGQEVTFPQGTGPGTVGPATPIQPQ